MNAVNCKPLLLLLWRSRGLRTFHFRNYLAVNNYNSATDHYGWNSTSNINRHHRPVPPVYLLASYKAHANSQQHFCTNSTTTTLSNGSSDQNNTRRLPDPIEQQCEEWVQILRAEWEAGNAKHHWQGMKLRCTNVRPGLKTTRLSLSTEDLTPEQLRILHQFYKISNAVELKMTNLPLPQFKQQSNSVVVDPLDNSTTIMSGIVTKHLPRGDILISVNQYFNLQQRQLLQQCSFDIRKTENPTLLKSWMAFLEKRHTDWCKSPGYATMLKAFKCQALQEDTGLDPVDWVGSRGKDLDPSQCAALSAALNLKRPIVAVHGPPGSGKTHLLTEYLHTLSQQRKKVLVLSNSNAGLYHLLGTFCKKFPTAASRKGTFLYLKHFDARLASKDEETRKNYKLTQTLQSAMEKRQDLREDDLMREAEEVSGQMREISHQMKDETSKNLLQRTSILFTNISYSMLNLFVRTGLTFDVVIIDDAAKLSEFDSWSIALPTTPILRLFGDYNQPGLPVNSSIARELNFGKSLLQRLDEEFGEEVNFHLRHQYRSNAAIQAWPNRAFYGQRAAEPDESVRNIRLDDLLKKSELSLPSELVTDPLVLVDLGQLEGEWRDGMFKAEKGGKSWQNWGEAFLTASHLWHLFEHIPQLCPSDIAYLTHHDAQRNLLWKIFSSLFKHHLQKYDKIRIERSANVQGQQFDVILKDSVTIPPPEAMVDPFHLKRVNFEISRARRQFIWFANSKWLEQGSEQSRQLLQTFREYGRIIGPNDLLPLGPGQFREMTKKVEENYYQKMHERR